MREIPPRFYSNPRSIGARIAHLRNDQKITQQEFVKRLRMHNGNLDKYEYISRSYLSNLECGHYTCSLELLTDIARELKCTRAYLLGEGNDWFNLSDEEKQILIVLRALRRAGIIVY